MITCRFCSKTLLTLRGYVLHCRVHRNEPRCVFQCLGVDCKRTFCTYAAFKAHFYRTHNVPEPTHSRAVVTNLKCAASLCARQFQTVKELLLHLKEHVVEGRAVSCPIIGCKNVFTKKSSFTAHMSRKHRACSVENINDMYRETACQSPGAVYEDASQVSPDPPSTSENGELPQNFSETFLRNICLFYLRLQGQLLLPASTIQIIVEEMQNLHELGQDYTLSKLHSFLKDDMSLTDDDITKICDCVRDSDLFSACHKGPLRTTYARAQTFKHMFKYIEPKKLTLGIDENMSQRYASYIPVK